MPSSSRPGRIERVRPWLGTLVQIACVGLPAARAHRSIEDAFAAVADVHGLMSFHEPTSDVSRLNRDAAERPVAVDAQTFAVLALARGLSEASGGAFDISVGERLVRGGRLPRPASDSSPDPEASWRDIELLEGERVRFHRPLWIDLGGIAKGFAVDQAIKRVAVDEGVLWVVNAGGDLRVAGDGAERVLLRTDGAAEGEGAAVMHLENASLASSSGRRRGGRLDRQTVGPHLDGRSRRAVGGRSFVSVVAPRCAVADALTNVVLARRAGALSILNGFGATAFLQDARGRWRTLGASNDDGTPSGLQA